MDASRRLAAAIAVSAALALAVPLAEATTPTILSATATAPNQITVTFSEPVKTEKNARTGWSATGGDLGSLRISVGTSLNLDSGTDTVVFTLNGNLPDTTPDGITLSYATTGFGCTRDTARYGIFAPYECGQDRLPAGDIEDLAGNKLVARSGIPVSDGIAPTFTARATSLSTIAVTFSEIIGTGGAAAGTWTLSGSDAGSRTISSQGNAPTALTISANLADRNPDLLLTYNRGPGDLADSAGNEPGGTVRVLDRIAPLAPSITTATGAVVTAPSIDVAGTAEAGSRVAVYVGGSAARGTVTAGADGSWAKSVPLASGDNAITAKATDRLGNESPASTSITARYNPAGTVITTPPAEFTVASQAISGVAPTGSSVSLYRQGDSTALGTDTADASTGAWSISATLAAGRHAYYAESTKAGATVRSGTVTFEYNALTNSVAPVSSVQDGEGIFTTLGGPRDVKILEQGGKTYALVAAGSEDGLQLIDMSDPREATAVSSTRTSGIPYDIEIADVGSKKFALVATHRGGAVDIFDITNITDIQKARTVKHDALAPDGSAFSQLRGAKNLDYFTVNSKHYVIVAADAGKTTLFPGGFLIMEFNENVATPGTASAPNFKSVYSNHQKQTDSQGREVLYAQGRGGYGQAMFDPFAYFDADGHPIPVTREETIRGYGAKKFEVPLGGVSINTWVLTVAKDSNWQDSANYVTDPANFGTAWKSLVDSRGNTRTTGADGHPVQIDRIETAPSRVLVMNDAGTPGKSDDWLEASFGYGYKHGSIFRSPISERQTAHDGDSKLLSVDAAGDPFTRRGQDSTGAAFAALEGAASVDTFTVTKDGATKTYAAIAAEVSDGVQIIDVSDPADPRAVKHVLDGGLDPGGRTFAELDGATGIETVTVGTKVYAVVASYDDDGFQVIDLSDPASPKAVSSGSDTPGRGQGRFSTLDGATSVHTFSRTVAGADRTYAMITATGYDEDRGGGGFQLVDITNPAVPTPAGNGRDGERCSTASRYNAMGGATSAATAVIGGKLYSVVTGMFDDGIQLVQMDMSRRGSTLVVADAILDDTGGYFALGAPRSSTVAEINGRTYVFAGSYKEEDGNDGGRVVGEGGGVQIIDVTNPALPKPAAGLVDSDHTPFNMLKGVGDIDVFQVNGRSYAIVTAQGEYGYEVNGTARAGAFMILDVTNPETPRRVAGVLAGQPYTGGGSDQTTFMMSGPIGVDTAEIDGRTYAAIASNYESNNRVAGVSIVDVTNPASPKPTAWIGQGSKDAGNNTYSLIQRNTDVEIFSVGEETYAIVASPANDAVTIIDISTPAKPKLAGTVSDPTNLRKARTVSVVTMDNSHTSGEKTYAAVVGGTLNNAGTGFGYLSMIDVTDPSSPNRVQTVQKGGQGFDISGAYGVDTYHLGGKTYAAVSCGIDIAGPYNECNGVTVLEITDPDGIAQRGKITDESNTYGHSIQGVHMLDSRGIDTFVSGTAAYSASVSFGDSGMEIARLGTATDGAAPAMTGVTYNPDRGILEIAFNELIRTSSGNVDLAKLAVNSAVGASSAGRLSGATLITASDAKTMSVSVSDAQKTAFATLFASEPYPKLDVTAGAFDDQAGNDVQAAADVEIRRVETAPVLLESVLEMGPGTMRLFFSEAVDVTPASGTTASPVDLSKFKVYDPEEPAGKTALSGSRVANAADDRTLVVRLDEAARSAISALGTVPVIDLEAGAVRSSEGGHASEGQPGNPFNRVYGDSTPPRLVSAVRDSSALVLTFTEKVKVEARSFDLDQIRFYRDGQPGSATYLDDGGGLPDASVSTTADSDTVRIALTSAQTAAIGTHKDLVLETVLDEGLSAVEDLFGYGIGEASAPLRNPDGTGPALDSSEAPAFGSVGGTLTVTFSEGLWQAETDPSKFHVRDGAGNSDTAGQVTPTPAELRAGAEGADAVKFHLSEESAAAIAAMSDPHLYLDAGAAKGADSDPSAAASAGRDVSEPSQARPSISSASAQNLGAIRIDFTKPVKSEASAQQLLGAWSLSGPDSVQDGLPLTVLSTTTLSSATESLVLTLQGRLPSLSPDASVVYDAERAPIADAADSALTLSSATVAISVAPTFTAEATALNQITVTFSERVTATGTSGGGGWSISGGDWNSLTVSSRSDISGGSTTLLLNLSGNLPDTKPDGVLLGYDPAAGDVEDGDGNEAPPGPIRVSDGIAPTATARATALDKITVTFSESLSVSDLTARGWSISGTDAAGRTVDSSTASSGVAGSDASSVVLTLDGNLADTAPDAALRYETSGTDVGSDQGSGSGAIRDGASNAMAADSSIPVSDGIAPTFEAEATALDKITVTFGEDVAFTAGAGAGGWSISGGDYNNRSVASRLASGTDAILLELDGDILNAAPDGIKIAYDAAGGDVRDAASPANDLASASDIDVGDGIAPTIASAVSGTPNTVTVTFSEPVDATSTGAAGTWTLGGTGLPAGVTVDTNPAISSGSTVLGLSGNLNDPIGQVTLTYNDGPGDAEDKSDNALASQTVTLTQDPAPTVSSARVTGPNEATVTYSEAVTAAQSDYSSLTIDGNARNILSLSGGTTEAHVLAFDGGAAGTGATGSVSIDASSVRDSANSVLGTSTALSQQLTDGQAPTLGQAAVHEGTGAWSVSFSETVSAGTATGTVLYMREAGGGAYASSTDVELAVSSSTDTFSGTLSEADRQKVISMATPTVYAVQNAVQDAASNGIAAASAAVSATSDGTAPALTGVLISGAGAITLQFSETVKAGDSDVAQSNVFVRDGSGTTGGTGLVGATVTSSGASASVEIAPTAAQRAAVLGYAAPHVYLVAGAVEDTTGNANADSASSTPTAVPLVLNSASVDLNNFAAGGDRHAGKLTLVFNTAVAVHTSEADTLPKITLREADDSPSLTLGAGASIEIDSNTATVRLSPAQKESVRAMSGNLELLVGTGAFKSVNGALALPAVGDGDLPIPSGSVTADTTAPGIASATVNEGTGIVTFNFDELVQADGADVQLGQVQLYTPSEGNYPLTGSTVTSSGDAAAVTIRMTEAVRQNVIALSNPQYWFSGGTAIQDLDGNFVPANAIGESTEIADTLKPEISSTPPDLDEGTGILTLTFNETVKAGDSDVQQDKIRVRDGSGTSGGTSLNGATVTSTGNSLAVTLRLTEVQRQAAIGYADPHVYFKAGAVKDTSDQDIAESTTSTSIDDTDGDTTAPAVSSAVVNEATGAWSVVFSETVSAGTATGTVMYVGEAGRTAYVSSTDVALAVPSSATSSSGTLSATDLQKVIALIAPTIYVVQNAVQDTSGNGIAAANTAAAPPDTTAPTLSSATVNEGTGAWSVTFSETVSAGTATGTVLYMRNTGGGAYASSTDVALTVPSSAVSSSGTLSEADRQKVISMATPTVYAVQNAVKDTSNNGIAAANTAATVTPDTALPAISSATVNEGTGAWSVTFSETVSAGTATGTVLYMRNTGGGAYASSTDVALTVPSSAVSSSGTLSEADRQKVISMATPTVYAVLNAVKDTSNNGIAAASAAASQTPDRIAPTLDSMTTPDIDEDSGVLTLTFNETVKAGDSDVQQDKIRVRDGSGTSGGTSLNGATVTSTGNSLAVTLRLTEVQRQAAIGYADPHVYFKAGAVKDTSDQDIAESTTSTSIDDTDGDTTAPAVSSATINEGTGAWSVTFSEQVSAGTATGTVLYMREAGGGAYASSTDVALTVPSSAVSSSGTLSETDRQKVVSMTTPTVYAVLNAVKDTSNNGIAAANTAATVTPDTTLPVISSATINEGTGAWSVTFSETVSAGSASGTVLYMRNTGGGAYASSTDVALTVPSSAVSSSGTLSEADRQKVISMATPTVYAVLNAVKDTSNNGIAAANTAATVTPDTTLPVISSATINEGTGAWSVTFSETVSAGSASGTVLYMRNTGGGAYASSTDVALTVPSSAVSSSGTLSETDRQKVVSMATPTVYAVLNAVKDTSNNGIAAANTAATVTPDTTLPVISSATINEGTGAWSVVFSEQVSAGTATGTVLYMREAGGGAYASSTDVALTVPSSAVSSSGTLSEADRQKVISMATPTVYAVLNAVKDTSNNGIAAASAAATPTSDTEAPVISSATINEGTGAWSVTFSEQVSAGTATGTVLYMREAGGGAYVSSTDVELTVSSSTDTFSGTMSETDRQKVVSMATPTVYAVLNAVKDTSNNGIAAASAAASQTPDRLAPTLDSMTTPDIDEDSGVLTLTFNETVKAGDSDVQQDKIRVRDGSGTSGGTSLNGATVTSTGNSLAVTLRLTEVQRQAAIGYADPHVYFKAGAVKDTSDQDIAESTTSTSIDDTDGDTTAPAVSSATINEGTGAWSVTFSETVSAGTATGTVLYMREAGGGAYASSTDVALTVPSSAVSSSGTLSETDRQKVVSMTTPTVYAVLNAVKDTSNNGIAAANTAATVTPDTTAPAISSATINEGTGAWSVTFSETVSAGTATGTVLYMREAGGGAYASSTDVALTVPASSASSSGTLSETDRQKVVSMATPTVYAVLNAVKDTSNNGIAAANTAATVTPDTTAPAISSATINEGTGAWSVTFSETVSAGTATGTVLYMREAGGGAYASSTDVALTVPSSAVSSSGTLSEADRQKVISMATPTVYAVLNAVKDTSNNGIAAANTAATVTPDTTAPAISSATINEGTGAWSVTFSETVSAGTATGTVLYMREAGGGAYASSTDVALTVPSSAVSSSGTLSETDRQKVVSMATPTVYAVLNAVKDTSNNGIAAASAAATPTSDTTAPAVSSATINEGTGAWSVTFSETVSAGTATGTVLYMREAGGGAYVSSTDVELAVSSSTDTFSGTLSESDRQRVISMATPTVYAVLNAVKDTSNNGIAAASAAASQTTDGIAPTISVAVINEGTGIWYVTFSEIVSAGTATGTVMYVGEAGGGAYVSSTDVALTVPSSSATSSGALPESDRQKVVALATPTVYVVQNAVKDTSNNGIAAAGRAASTTADAIVPVIVSAEATALDRITVTFSEPVLGTATPPSTTWRLHGADSQGIDVSQYPAISIASTVALVLSGPLPDTDPDLNLQYVRGPGDIADSTGVPLESTPPPHVAVSDGISPALRSSAFDDGTGILELTFAEIVDVSATVESSIHVRESGASSGGVQLTTSARATSSDSATVAFRLSEQDRQAVIAMASPQLAVGAGAVRDLSGNTIAAVSDSIAAMQDTVPPVLQHAALDEGAGTISLRFDEKMSLPTEAQAARIEIGTAGSNIAFAAADIAGVSLDGAATTVTITVYEAKRQEIIAADASDIDVLAGGLRDVSGAQARSEGTAFGSVLPDDDKPSLDSAVLYVDGGLLALVFDETMDAGSFAGELSKVSIAAPGSAVPVSGSAAAQGTQIVVTLDARVLERLLAAVSAANAAGAAAPLSLQVPGPAPQFADTSGNVAEPVSGSVLVEDGRPPALISARVTDSRTIVAQFNEDLDNATVQLSDFYVPGYAISAAAEQDGTVTLTLAADASVRDRLRVEMAGAVSDLFGNVLPPGSSVLSANLIMPVAVSQFTASHDGPAAEGDRIRIVFRAQDGISPAVVLRVNGQDVQAAASPDGFEATYRVPADARQGALELYVRLVSETGAPTEFSERDLTGPNPVIDTLRPSVRSATISGVDSVTITYDEPVTASASDYTGIVAGGAPAAPASAVEGSGGAVILVSWAGSGAVPSDVSLTAGAVADLAGNEADPSQVTAGAPQKDITLDAPAVPLAAGTVVESITAPPGTEPVVGLSSLTGTATDARVAGAGGGTAVFETALRIITRTPDLPDATFPAGTQAGGLGPITSGGAVFAEGITISASASTAHLNEELREAYPVLFNGFTTSVQVGDPNRDIIFDRPVLLEFDIPLRGALVFSVGTDGLPAPIPPCDPSWGAESLPVGQSVPEDWPPGIHDDDACVDAGADSVWTGHFSVFGVSRYVSGGGSECDDCTPPTLGYDEYGAKLVDAGFSYNGLASDVEYFFTPYPLIESEVGAENAVVLKIYENEGPGNVIHAALAFGLRSGEVISESRAVINYDISLDGTGAVSVIDPDGAIDLDTLAAEHETVECSPGSELECLQVTITHAFRAPLEFDIVGTDVWDSQRNSWQNYYNHGIKISGEPLDGRPGIEVNGGELVLHPISPDSTNRDVMISSDGHLFKLSPEGRYEPLSNQSRLYHDIDESMYFADGVPMQGYDREDPEFRDRLYEQVAQAQRVLDSMMPAPEAEDSVSAPAPPDRQAEEERLRAAVAAEQERARLLFEVLFGYLEINGQN